MNANFAPSPPPTLILGSSSVYRRELLARLRLPFEVLVAGLDETPLPGELPAEIAKRLALAKAQACATAYAATIGAKKDVIIIGSDQVADFNGLAIGKPHEHDRAVQQLQLMRGQTVVFQTAVAVIRPHTGFSAVRLVPVKVRFRDLTDQDIETYLRLETPYDCAGSAKSEGLGITLLQSIESDDPTALIGLPLIATSAMLREAGLDPLTELKPSHITHA